MFSVPINSNRIFTDTNPGIKKDHMSIKTKKYLTIRNLLKIFKSETLVEYKYIKKINTYIPNSDSFEDLFLLVQCNPDIRNPDIRNPDIRYLDIRDIFSGPKLEPVLPI